MKRHGWFSLSPDISVFCMLPINTAICLVDSVVWLLHKRYGSTGISSEPIVWGRFKWCENVFNSCFSVGSKNRRNLSTIQKCLATNRIAPLNKNISIVSKCMLYFTDLFVFSLFYTKYVFSSLFLFSFGSLVSLIWVRDTNNVVFFPVQEMRMKLLCASRIWTPPASTPLWSLYGLLILLRGKTQNEIS